MLRSRRVEHTAVTLSGGLVLIIGGFTSEGSTTMRAELYKPPSG
jgi:hypothetical protein